MRRGTEAVKTNYKLALAVLAGVSIGVVGAKAIHAQQTKTRPGYVIAEIEVTDPATLQKYGEKAPQIVASFGGRYVVRGGGKIQALEGEAPKGYGGGNRLRQRRESKGVLRFADLHGDQGFPAKCNQGPPVPRRRRRPAVTAHFRPQV
jgi:hypothetical protein